MTPEKLRRMSRENVEYWLLHQMHRKAHDIDAGLVQLALERIAPYRRRMHNKPICPC